MNDRDKIVEMISVTAFAEGGYKVLDKADLVLPQGSVAVISDSTVFGKTLLVELLLGIKKPRAGIIKLFGKSLNVKNARLMRETRRKIGGVGGVFKLIEGQSVAENLVYPLLVRGDSPSSRKSRLKQVLTQFNLLTKRRDDIRALSAGERTMVMIARAVIADQPLLLIDSPIDGLERTVAAEILNVLKRLSVAGHGMIILTTGQGGIDISNAQSYELKEGRFI